MAELKSPARVRAVLGPTNTGKTHYAMERMLAHATGMIGFPLRLLARENYDRAVAARGAHAVALITGEERIVPRNPRWFVCTVEAMPLDRPVEFLAVDEIQLCADAERGHIFTDRLLHARGSGETLFLGSDTMRRTIRSLVSDIVVEERPRLSELRYAGTETLRRIRRRTALVAFSIDAVYELAMRLRKQRGGTAVVVGALSPRARNAQVAMYQAGEVDYMVATDAIGMGLNMDVGHVAFAGLRKFDGRRLRRLAPAETGQIAGRAGRHMNDGTFGVLKGGDVLPPQVVEAIEAHRFDPVRKLSWRSRDLDFRSPKLLLRSLLRPPGHDRLVLAEEAEDQRALATLVKDPGIADRASRPDTLRLLWQVCRIPDFRKTLPGRHAEFLKRIFLNLTDGDGRLPVDWVRRSVAGLDDAQGEIDTLMLRIAHIRSWTYISHRDDWLDDAGAWQARAGAIEDRLSDALHERLTHHFVEFRSASLRRRLDEGEEIVASVTASGDILAEGRTVGRIEGFEIVPQGDLGRDRRILLAAARRAALREMPARVARFCEEEDPALTVDSGGAILWRGTAVARLVRGREMLAPELRTLPGSLLEGPLKDRVADRLDAWLAGHLARAFRPLLRAQEMTWSGPARGLIFQLAEHLGSLPAPLPPSRLALIDREERRRLSRAGLRIGPGAVYFERLVRPRVLRLRATLWRIHKDPANAVSARRGSAPGSAQEFVQESAPRTACPAGGRSAADWACLGYRRLGAWAVRCDRVERLERTARRLGRQGPFAATPELVGIVGLDAAAFAQVMAALGFRIVQEAGEARFRPKSRPGRNGRQRSRNGRSGATRNQGERAGAARSQDKSTGTARSQGARAETGRNRNKRRGTGRNRGRRSGAGHDPASPFAVLRDLTPAE